MRTALIIVLMCLLSGTLVGQRKELNLPPQKNYKKALLGFQASPNELEANDIYLFADSLTYQSGAGLTTYQYDQIKYIKVNEGSYAGLGAAIGGSLMLLTSLFAILEVSNDPNRELNNNAGFTLALFTIGGTGLGALVGLPFKRKRTYYLHYR